MSGEQDKDPRLARIAWAHVKDVDEHGGTYGICRECGHRWPCPTAAWANADADRVGINCTWDLTECEFTEHERHEREVSL